MGRTLLILGAVILVIAGFLFVPYALRDTLQRPLVGPTLQEITFEEVVFKNGDLVLAGMLLLPAEEGPHPAAVFIHGSGTSQRDNPWYLSVARHLQDNGIAVLLPDKRGSEVSGGDWRDTTLDELATDTVV